MEKIKKALEKARQDRARSESTAATAPRDEVHAPPVDASSTSIQYVKTRTVDSSVDHMRESRLISAMERSEYTESLKILSSQVLKKMGQNDWSSLAVISARNSTGVSTVTINLGLSIAREVEYTVLVVDANLRDPSIHDYFGMKPASGLSDYLTSDVNLSELLLHPKDIDHFVLLPAGSPITNSAELLGSPRMHQLAEELKTRYPKRIVLYDLPAVLETADAINFLPCVDSALLVIEDEETKIADLHSVADMIGDVDLVGTVLNKSTN